MFLQIGIVDDKMGNRNLLHDKLMRHGQFKITLTATDGKDFLDKMQQTGESLRPQVVLMDLEMPGMDGVAAIAAGSTLYPDVKFVVLTIFDDEEKIFKAIKAGAYGYLLKDESMATIGDMLCQMHESGAGPISPGIAYKILQLVQKKEITPLPNIDHNSSNNFFDLTEREKEILALLVKGFLYKEIGAHLYITANTAKKHVMNIFHKLHVNSRAQAMNLAYEKGLL